MGATAYGKSTAESAGASAYGKLKAEDVGAAHADHNHGGLGQTFYTHEQSPASSVWVINHNLSYRPAGIKVFDSAGTEYQAGNIAYPSLDTIVLTWSFTFSGKAYIS